MNVSAPSIGSLGKLLAVVGFVLSVVLFVVGRLVGIEAGLFALAFAAVILA